MLLQTGQAKAIAQVCCSGWFVPSITMHGGQTGLAVACAACGAGRGRAATLLGAGSACVAEHDRRVDNAIWRSLTQNTVPCDRTFTRMRQTLAWPHASCAWRIAKTVKFVSLAFLACISHPPSQQLPWHGWQRSSFFRDTLFATPKGLFWQLVFANPGNRSSLSLWSIPANARSNLRAKVSL